MPTLGHSGRILRVDLTRATLEAETLDEEVWRTYAGGALLGTRILLTETVAGLDPLGADALLVYVTGAVAGHAAVGLPRFSVVGKSPLTGGIGEARCEGPFGIALTSSGFDAIVVRGRAEAPTTLLISDGRPALRPAPDLWGLDTSETVDRLSAELGACHVACIGPAGERLVRYASIVSDRSFAAARMGLGAVMGAKLLKAVVLRGGTPPVVADPDALEALTRSYRERMDGNPLTRWQHEPPGFGAWVGGVSMPGYLGVENYRTSVFADADGYAPAAFERQLAWNDGGCPGCPNDCIKGFAASTEPPISSAPRTRRAGGLHQEAVAALGPNLGLPRVETPLRLNDRCLRLGLDPVSLGFTLSFVMEAREHGLLGATELDGAELRFGGEARWRRPSAGSPDGRASASGSARGSDGFAAESASRRRPIRAAREGPRDGQLRPEKPGGAGARATRPLRWGLATTSWSTTGTSTTRDPAWPQTLDLSRTLGILRRMPDAGAHPREAPRRPRPREPVERRWTRSGSVSTRARRRASSRSRTWPRSCAR